MDALRHSICEINEPYYQAANIEIDDFACWNLMSETVFSDISFIEDFVAMYDAH